MNVRNREAQERARTGRSNGARLFGIVFLLMVMGVMIAGGFGRSEVDERCLPFTPVEAGGHRATALHHP